MSDQESIESQWEERARITPGAAPQELAPMLVARTWPARRRPRARGAEAETGWVVHEWLKKAVLLSFRLQDNAVRVEADSGLRYYDKVALKFDRLDEALSSAPRHARGPACRPASRRVHRSRTSS